MDGFDPRIVEHVLQGFDKSRPNSNMLDFGVMAMDETYGRERRHRWFTSMGYKALLTQENINGAEHELPVDLANIGGFTDTSPELFYNTQEQLYQHQDMDSREETTRKKRKPPKNPILPDGTVKRGRPRKNQPSTSKRKREDLAEDDGADGQGRPLKRAKTVAAGVGVVFDADKAASAAEPTPRKRGRPPKRKPEGEPPATPTPRKRGRPPKNRTPATAVEQESLDVGEQTLPTTAPSVSAQEAVSETARDTDGLPALSYPEVSGQQVQQGGPPEADNPTGDSQPTPPPELQLPTPEPRELVRRSQQDVDYVGYSLTIPKLEIIYRFVRIRQLSLPNHPQPLPRQNPLPGRENPTCLTHVVTMSSIGSSRGLEESPSSTRRNLVMLTLPSLVRWPRLESRQADHQGHG